MLGPTTSSIKGFGPIDLCFVLIVLIAILGESDAMQVLYRNNKETGTLPEFDNIKSKSDDTHKPLDEVNERTSYNLGDRYLDDYDATVLARPFIYPAEKRAMMRLGKRSPFRLGKRALMRLG
ncbi:hypothetical protein WR25_08103 [Diploscapter pachys]|uniref:Uncharacterized protein n=1 Tax=Diploscapter pachys TaxID=2018661 RepID=A0A2A2KWA5_9BILA|nr:hypothetical protein WR25_08103 [Diploscapter pachys]